MTALIIVITLYTPQSVSDPDIILPACLHPGDPLYMYVRGKSLLVLRVGVVLHVTPTDRVRELTTVDHLHPSQSSGSRVWAISVLF